MPITYHVLDRKIRDYHSVLSVIKYTKTGYQLKDNIKKKQTPAKAQTGLLNDEAAAGKSLMKEFIVLIFFCLIKT